MKLLLLFLILFSSIFASNDLDEVTLYLKWKHQFQFAGFYIAKEKGFYKDVGLKVDIKEARKNQKTLELVLEKKNRFGISDSILVYEKMLGKKIAPLGAIFQKSLLIFLYLKKSNINSIEDLKNKRIMLDLNSSDHSLFSLILNKYQINENELKIVNTSYDINDLLEGNIDIYSSYISNELYNLQKLGIEYDYIDPKKFAMNFYGDILFTSLANKSENPEKVDAFYTASIKGWEYAFNNIDETINLLINKYNTQDFTYEKYLYEANILKELSEIEKGNLGKLDLDRINHIYTSYILTKNNLDKKITNNFDLFSFYNSKIDEDNSKIFTKIEENYLNKKKEITYCAFDNVAPLSFYQNDKYKGISIDFIKEIEKKINLPFKAISVKNENECFSLIKKNKIDFSSITLTEPNIYKSIKTSKPYIKGHLVLVTKINEPYFDDMSNFKEKIIAVSKVSKNIQNLIKIKYPNLNIKLVSNLKEGLDLLTRGEVFGFIGISTVTAFKIQEEYAFELKIMNRLGDNIQTGSFGVDKENNVLLSILNKTINNIDDKTKREIKNSWISVKKEELIDYDYFWKFLFALIVFFIALSYRSYVLKQINVNLEKKVKEELEKNRKKDMALFQQNKLIHMGEMLNNIAHQWRQPLNTINSNVAAIDSIFVKKNLHDKDLENNLIEIENQTNYMSETIESFSNYFNPRKDKEKFLISSAIVNTISILKYSFDNVGIRIKIVKINDIIIEAYLGEYIQTLISILNNSKDAFLSRNIKNPEIIIVIDEMLIIDDNAGGIDAEIIDRIFEPYFTTKHQNNGTGTGLYMAKMLIEKSMGGDLSVENIKNGTRFKIKV